MDDSSIYKEENQPCKLIKEIEQPILSPQEEGGNNADLPREWKFVHNHPRDLILGDPTKGIETHFSLRNICSNLPFLSQIEPKNFQEAEFDEHWMISMHEELNQFERNKVWELMPKPKDHTIIGTKWIFRNKLDEFGTIMETRLDLLHKDTIKKKVLISMKPLLLLLD